MRIQTIRPLDAILLSVFCLISVTSVAQKNHGNEHQHSSQIKENGKHILVKGDVHDAEGKVLSGVIIYAQKGKISAETDQNGHYEFPIAIGRERHLTLHFTAVGYKTKTKEFSLSEDSLYTVNETITQSSDGGLEHIQVSSSAPIQTVRESAYNVVAIDAAPYYNTTMDLAHLLDKASGVRIREVGGVGSGMSISLNGFTGRHVKVFMDGVPMEGMGSSFQLNNIPVNIAERIEVYKGVVPIEFGTDAIGGVINIVTKKGRREHLDVSYSYGSFNTHKSNIDYGITTKKGFTFNINAFQNYSDNSYKIWMDEILNLNTLVYEQNPQWVKRFHDQYHNETVVAKAGFVNKKWTDKFLLGVTLGQEKSDIQNAYLQKIVYGQRQREGHTVMPNLTYIKKNLFTNGLNVSLSSNYSDNYNKNIDTAARRYNWLDEWVTKRTVGEAGSTLAEFRNKNFSANANATYHFGRQHTIAINDVFNHFVRKSEDPAADITDESQMAQYMDRKNTKNVFGASYKYDFDKRWNTTVFAKNYNMSVSGPVNNATVVNQYDWGYQSKSNSIWGYGLATTYFLFQDLQLKASYEKAVRMPTDGELFGDQVLLTENASLRPEKSHNYNLGGTYNKQVGLDNSLYIDLGLMYRSVYDYIRQVNNEATGTQGSVNHGKVSNMGVNAEIKYFYRKMFSIGGNITYQNLRNKERTVSAISNISTAIYNDRLPNIPYFFGTTDLTGFFKDVFVKGSAMTVTYNMNYVHSFYLYWPSQGASNTKKIIPEQISHDVMASYALANGKYNIGLEGRNLTNRKLYDNFSLQRPGRSFAIKLRYNLQK